MSYIELNKSAFYNNLDIIAKKTADVDKIALVLKDNAYGHGLNEIAKMAKEYGLSKVVVRNTQEADRIKDLFEYILILSPDFSLPSQKNYIYTINCLDDLDKVSSTHRMELKVDTGMHRNGICMEDLQKAFERIKEKNLNIEALFTHYRSADAMSSEWFWQKKNFEEIKAKSHSLMKELGILTKLRFHSYNSAGVFRISKFDEDMVRVGIAAYGCLQMDKGFKQTGLKPVLSLYAQKISTRLLKKGEKLGYNATYETKEDMYVSNYDVGYADGLKRSLSNNYKTPQGYNLLGRVSMDNSSYNSTKQKLLIFDDANKIAEFADTIGYEMLTSLSPYMKRVILE